MSSQCDTETSRSVERSCERDPRMELGFILDAAQTPGRALVRLAKTQSPQRTVSKPRWTPEEDELLCKLVSEFGAKRWKRFEQHFPGREGFHIRAHWKHHFENAESKRPFSAKDDEELLAAYKILGAQWSRIARQMDRRIDNDVKNRFKLLMRRQALEAQRNV
uniref:Uncharacterized protein n=1 Tax=Erythrolobus australicus TaxID=1077150 RepID=A0A7S1XHT9_9RHOD|mmetsp:Transcript_574/g.1507  ORF Transcript_574/g.1507 Transcript_574/m.1507 type:complete len:163 (+) Transcript_574:258-746(+)